MSVILLPTLMIGLLATPTMGSPAVDLSALDEALSTVPGYVGLAESADGRPVATAYFTVDAPGTLPIHLLPPGWSLQVERTEFTRAIARLDETNLAFSAPRTGPPVPAAYEGIGPGSRLVIAIPQEGRFGCTANFVWEDTEGELYLGTAGHCFLPDTARSANGTNADYDASGVRAYVCFEDCGDPVSSGTNRWLGAVVYARQQTGSSQVGHDFGIIRIPDELRDRVRPHMPVWNGPVVGSDTLTRGETALHYGHGIVVGEAWPTMARAGVGVAGSTTSWGMIGAAAPGDSGSALVTGIPTEDDQIVEGYGAAGILTHLSGCCSGPIVGTSIPRAIQMVKNDIDLDIRVVLQGEDVTE